MATLTPTLIGEGRRLLHRAHDRSAIVFPTHAFLPGSDNREDEDTIEMQLTRFKWGC